MSSSLPARSERDLSSEEHQELKAAYDGPRAAVEDYEAFLGKELQPGADVRV